MLQNKIIPWDKTALSREMIFLLYIRLFTGRPGR